MGTTLDNGIYLPDEGERNCYEGLAGNWVALDNHLGSTNIHVTINDKQAWDGHVADTTIHVTSADKQAWNSHVADTTIHVTSADKQAWNGKADASALAAHTGNTTIHVTAEDKNKWDAVTSKADDSAVVHKTGNETVGGAKTFLNSPMIYNSDTSTDTKYLLLRNQKVKRGSTTETGTQFITFQDKDGGTLVSYDANVSFSGNTQAYINVSNLDANSQRVLGGVKVIKTPTETWFIPDSDNSVSSGLSNYKWSDVQTYKVNGVEPSSLSLPSGNRNDIIDISSYLTYLDGTDNTYIAPANGWITINMNNCSGIHATITGFWGDSRVRANAGAIKFLMPVLKNQTVTLTIHGGTINNARFIPCKGNV